MNHTKAHLDKYTVQHNNGAYKLQLVLFIHNILHIKRHKNVGKEKDFMENAIHQIELSYLFL